MQFKIDENLPIEIATILINEGHDAMTVNEQQMTGAADQFLIQRCKDENRILVTLDKDFSDIRTYPPEEYEGITILRVASQGKQHIIKIFQQAIHHIDIEHLSRHLCIIGETLIRIRGSDD
jgi:predicted nuclease of predicted toxin-antitoxin system